MLSPQIVQLASQKPHVLFVKVDVDRNESLAAKWKVTAIPHSILFVNGIKFGEVIGANYGSIFNLLKNFN